VLYPRKEFEKASCMDANVEKGLIVDLFNRIDEEKWNFHSLLMVKDGAKVFEAYAINEELEAYLPLIPDGHNWKATFMIEYEEPDERAIQLARMIGIENKVWLQVADCERIHPIADEDLERDNGLKTSSVHFLRFELTLVMIAAVRGGAAVSAGIDHPAYTVPALELPLAVRDSLANDLQAHALN